MKRLARHAFTALSALSLVLGVAVAVTWAVDVYSPDFVRFVFSTGPFAGKTALLETRGFFFEWWTRTSAHDPPQLTGPPMNVLGWWFGGDRAADGSFVYRFVIVPYWFPLLVTGLLPALSAIKWARRRRDARRRALNRCSKCGYDLRASPDRCPECGAPVRPGSPQAATTREPA